MIPFNKPYFTGKETHYIEDAVRTGKISGNGKYTKMCQSFFEERYGFGKCLLTTSCTDALEMAAILLNLKAKDEVIMPSYTFVSTANAFVLRGAKIVFADSMVDNPNLDASQVESLITSKTKAIVVVHYAGVACDMDTVMNIASKHNLYVIEDAAQAIDSYYKGKPLGSIGHLAAFSFHETKNLISGEGGMLVINDKQFEKRSEIIWEKGTNRSAFYRGEVDKYGWVDIGSSFLPSDIIAAFLYAQIENLDDIQSERNKIWKTYYDGLSNKIAPYKLTQIPDYATNNAHMFYLVIDSMEKRSSFISKMKKEGILVVFHYLSLHKSSFYANQHDGRELPNCDKFANLLVRLPMFYNIGKDQDYIMDRIQKHFAS